MQQKLFFKNSRGDRLCGILSSPAGGSGAIVILCHGFATSKDVDTYTCLERALNQNGVSTFRFDFFGHGESEGKFEDVTISEAVDDVLCAVSFVREKGFSKIALFGSSFGGMAALLAAPNVSGLFALALKSPVSDRLGKIIADEDKVSIEHWKKNGFILHESSVMGKPRLNYSFCKDAENVSAFDAAKKIRVPVLIVHGGMDKVVPVEQSKKTASLIPNCRLEIVQGADHHYSKPGDFEKMLALVSKFFAENA
ncbi:MAG: alpha/beta fold hydrolase [archaeon]